MIVCSCHAVTDREIRSAVSSGARTPCQIADACRAGSSCGGCRETVQQILAEANHEHRMPAPSANHAVRDSVSA